MRAIISVWDKTDVALLGRGLAAMGCEIFSTGGTQRALEAAGVPVKPVSDLTGFPEIMDGRVKTLHPAVYGGLLARRDVAGDLESLAQHGLAPIDLVAVNLYPFEVTTARRSVTLREALAQIDIGGPAMLRAAAKNYPSVLSICDPRDYPAVLEALRQAEGPGEAFRRSLAAKAFRHVAAYDALIAAYLGAGDPAWPEELALSLRKIGDLRYGENPRQRAAFYAALEPGAGPSGLVGARQLQGKPLSYNNILDADAAWQIASDFGPAAVAIIKHTNPCGLARAATALTAYERALAGDPLAAFGGIVAVNVAVDPQLAQRIAERFYEIVLAPEFDVGALARLAARPDLRVLALPFAGPEAHHLNWRSVTGGVLLQEGDHVGEAEVRKGQVATRRSPSEAEWAALAFAWRAVRYVRSNAIVLAQGEVLVGMGAGQPSRVAAVEIAVARAGARAEGAVLASDAFFPKADGVEAAIQAGVRAMVQPGGSRGDAEVIDAADTAGVAMVLTGTRHFLH